MALSIAGQFLKNGSATKMRVLWRELETSSLE